MVIIRLASILIAAMVINANTYLYYTEDSSSVEYYDCLFHSAFVYCRRPKTPISLQREKNQWQCSHSGIRHSFSSLRSANISVNTVALGWNSTLEMAGRYAQYLGEYRSSHNATDGYLCQCDRNRQSFGKYCEYRFPVGMSLAETMIAGMNTRKENKEKAQMHSDVLCYTTLECDFGLLCLDWRDICDGVQQCMLGYDEENCDLLEFHECESDEYRCMNGMCIPQEYFVDGDYDCMDLTDEKGGFDSQFCAWREASLECDERLCPPSQWPCGDGQCIPDRLAFQKPFTLSPTCVNQRDQYFMCEIRHKKRMWTMPNGKCSVEEYTVDTTNDECIHFIKCALSQGMGYNCPCRVDNCYYNDVENPCSTSLSRYPNGAILAPYLTFLFNRSRDWLQLLPDLIQINASIKCRGYTVHYQSTRRYMKDFNLRELEREVCALGNDRLVLTDHGYDEFCHNDSHAFSNRSYPFLDLCENSRECISIHRIRDGYRNCLDGSDEQQTKWHSYACWNQQHHRFRCSMNESTCLFVSSLSNLDVDCKNRYDESWLGTDRNLAKLNCKPDSKSDCSLIRQYIEASWNADYSSLLEVSSMRIIPFRAYCDSFWDFSSKKDEDPKLCREWWVCLDSQWRCRTGQCIDPEWVLDGEWDCSDGSDEEGIYFSNNTFSLRNLNLVNGNTIAEIFRERYQKQPLMSMCDPEKEFACYRTNASHSSHDIHDHSRFCISLEQLGDGQIDCLGAMDEQNTQEFCHRTTMLGRHFKCSSSDTCIPYSSVCDIRCPNEADDGVLCSSQGRFFNCSDPGLDFLCFDQTCATKGWCDEEQQCEHGEDEYLCDVESNDPKNNVELVHRRTKDMDFDYKKQPFQLPQFPVDPNKPKTRGVSFSTKSKRSSTTNIASSSTSYVCNRGIGVFTHNDSVICFCPQQYYGDRCQYHNDRLTLMLHMNFSRSLYTTSNNATVVLKMLVLFLFEEEVLSSYEFHTRPLAELTRYYKKIDHVVYPRSSQRLLDKRARYFNRSNIVHEQPYAVRIEGYKIDIDDKPDLIAVWQYPIYFDFLPSFRFAKVLHMTKPENTGNPCSSNPCEKQQICHQLLNNKSSYVCLCPENYYGKNCSQLNPTCVQGYCARHALCKAGYRGLLNRKELPYCVCPRDTYGFRCTLQQDQCSSKPCQNNGTCFVSATPGAYFCACEASYDGKHCEKEKAIIRLHINKTSDHQAAIIQYFRIDYFDLKLVLSHQRLYDALPPSVVYRLTEKSVTPEIIVIKLHSKTQVHIHLASVYINPTSFNATTEASESNRCSDVQTLLEIDEEISHFKYHRVCRDHSSLLCFHDSDYLCICDHSHGRAECFQYDHSLDRCSKCMAGGRCVHGDRSRADDYLCVCLPCHSGRFCQFSSESFSFTLDQLFSADLLSQNPLVRHTATYLLIIGSAIIFLLGFVNNIFAFVTFRRPKCLRNGSGQYLLFMSVINQINLGVLAIRLIHLTVNIISRRFQPIVNTIFCSLFNYLLIASSRITYWLVSLIAIERVYTTTFLNKRWLKKPHIARRLITVTSISILISGAYELVFVSSHSGFNDGKSAICILTLPEPRSVWMHLHQGVTITNALLPFLINLCCTATITYVVIQKKILLSQKNTHSNPGEVETSVAATTDTCRIRFSINKAKDRYRTRFDLLREVLHENKELVIGPAVTLVPQLFSLPLFIASLTLVCETIETSRIRYLLIVSYFTSFIPQLISFYLYISPSTVYSNEWHGTALSKRLTILKRFHRSTQTTNAESIIAIVDRNYTK